MYDEMIAEEKRFLDGIYRFMKYERLTWRIYSLVFLFTSLVIGALSLMMLGLGLYDMSSPFVSLGIVYLIMAVAYLPIPVIAFIMAPRVGRYMERVYTQPRAVLERASSVGMLVFCGLFCTIGMVFFIINFVSIKNNSHIVDRIIKRSEANEVQ